MLAALRPPSFRESMAMKPFLPPGYDYYHAALRGDFSRLPAIDDPAPGFYRHALSNEPVAIWPLYNDSGTPIGIRCVRGGREQSPEQMLALWPYCSAQPVPEDVWRHANETGDWPDTAPGLGMGHNRPPDETSPESRAVRTTDLAEQWLAAHPEVTTKAEADAAAHYYRELVGIVADLQVAEKDALRPWSGILAQITSKFRRLTEPASSTALTIRARLRPYLGKLDAEIAAERQRVREEADAARAEGKRAPKLPPPTRVGGRGHAVSLKTYWRADIEDYPMALEACASHEEVRDAVQTIANRVARESKGKTPLPGTKAIEDRR